MKIADVFLLMAASASLGLAQTAQISDYRLALPDHKGQLRWSVDGFTIIENSATPNGRELGFRGRDASGRLTFLGFLFLVPEAALLTSAKCRDGALAQDKKTNPGLKIVRTSEISRSSGLPVALVTYTAPNRDGSLGYKVRGFVATGDICGDLEFYSLKPISDEDADLKTVFQGYQMDADYVPQFSDLALYA